MQRNRPGSPSDAPELRASLVDDHAISRAACRALPGTEGFDVVADLALNPSSCEFRRVADVLDRSPLRGLEAAPTKGEHRLGDAPAVLVRGLRKTYDGLEAVSGIDLRIDHGEIFAFLGPNGAGKTTAVEILEGFRQRTEGEVSVLGVDPHRGSRAWRDRLRIVLQESAPDPGLTVNESMRLHAGYYAQPLETDAVLALVGLEAQANPNREQAVGRPAPAPGLRAGADRRPRSDLPR